MSWQDDTMIEQERADALFNMGEAEWRDTFMEAMEMAKEDQKETLKKAKRVDYNKKYWQEHKEQISAHRKEIYKRDRDKINERNKRWLKNNKEQWNAYLREYRRRKKLDREAQV